MSGSWQDDYTFAADVACPECEGTGGGCAPVRWAGEAYGEWVETRCERCGGRGVVPAVCRTCHRTAPCDRDAEACAECLEPLAPVTRISMTEIAA